MMSGNMFYLFREVMMIGTQPLSVFLDHPRYRRECCGRILRMSDSQPEDRGFESPRRHGVVSVSRIPSNPQLGGVAIIRRIPNLSKK
jgi:hypothetical protein